ncbi:MAG: hypothetical protein ACTSSE_13785 [Candidatus Thorarchaeota archaeon]
MAVEETGSVESQGSDVKSNEAYYVWAGGLVFAIVFTLLIWAVGPFLDPVLGTRLPDSDAEWYHVYNRICILVCVHVHVCIQGQT